MVLLKNARHPVAAGMRSKSVKKIHASHHYRSGRAVQKQMGPKCNGEQTKRKAEAEDYVPSNHFEPPPQWVCASSPGLLPCYRAMPSAVCYPLPVSTERGTWQADFRARLFQALRVAAGRAKMSPIQIGTGRRWREAVNLNGIDYNFEDCVRPQ